MHAHINPKNGEKAPLIADDVFEVIIAVRCAALRWGALLEGGWQGVCVCVCAPRGC